jgi:protein-S-isoprenylcysteine O-methyltransferase Ste14
MKALLRFLWFPAAVTAVVVFWWRLDSVFGWRGIHGPVAGGLLLLAGGAIVVWCNALFLGLGEGTANPFAAKTKRLVIVGPYRYVRNPMMWGVGTLLAGGALTFGSLGLWFALLTFLLFITSFVPLYEERDMERRFGEEFRDYCRRVPRWWPRFRSGKLHLSQ